MKKYGLIIGLFIILSILIYFFGNNRGYIKTGKLYISEIVASNSYTLESDGAYYDYIELYNDNNYDMNLKGYALSDSMTDIKKWVFDDFVIKKGEYKIIYASGLDKCDIECHTNFKLSKDGETVFLLDKTGNIVSKVTYPKLNSDTSFSLVGKDYIVTIPTPGKENKKEKLEEVNIEDYTIRINEYMTHNTKMFYASDGGYYDFIEIYNYGDKDLNLKGLSLSDDERNLNKYLLPEVIIEKKDYLVIYLTGGKEIDGVYANFKLSDTDKKIVLSGNEKVIDIVDIVKLDDNESYGKIDDKWYYFLTPTPGSENNTYAQERRDDNGSIKDLSSWV